MCDSPGKRLAAVRADLRLSQRGFAQSVGVSGGLIGQIEADLSPPSRSFLQKISDRYRISADWLLNGMGEMHQRPVDRSMLGVKASDYVQVQYATGGADGPMEDWGEYAFRSSWLRQMTTSPGECRFVRIAQNDMEPTIRRGGVVLIDPQLKQPNGGVFAFKLDGNLMVRRLAETDGLISITADNRAYSSMAARPEMVNVLGQAIWQCSTMTGMQP